MPTMSRAHIEISMLDLRSRMLDTAYQLTAEDGWKLNTAILHLLGNPQAKSEGALSDEHGPSAPDSGLFADQPRSEFMGCACCGSMPGYGHHPKCTASEVADRPTPTTLRIIPSSLQGLGVRKYLPTLAELIDRLSIVQLKQIFISEHAEAYAKERADIEHDIDILLKDLPPFDAKALHAVMMIMLSNRVIWEAESRARKGETQDLGLLKFSHSINGCRNTAKNVIAVACGERQDHKIDALAADLPAEYGNWAIWK